MGRKGILRGGRVRALAAVAALLALVLAWPAGAQVVCTGGGCGGGGTVTSPVATDPISFTGAGTCDNVANTPWIFADGLQDSTLTAGRVTFAGASGRLSDSAVLLGGATVATDNSTNFLRVTGTLPASPSTAVHGIQATITGAGSAAQNFFGLRVSLAAGYTGSAVNGAGYFSNATAGTVAVNLSDANANHGVFATSTATTTGQNVGLFGQASGGSISVGVVGDSRTSKNSASNVGGWFTAMNGGTSPTYVGVYAATPASSANPTLTSTPLLVDNGSAAIPVAVFRDNGTAVFTIGDGGATSMTSTLIGDLLSVETVATTKSPAVTEATEIYTNGSDVDGQAITLLNDPPLGVCYSFALTSTDTSNSFAIAPSAGETLQDAGTSCATSFSATAKGATARICAVSGGSGALWLVMSKNGTWSCS